jgi:hypothetical protein
MRSIVGGRCMMKDNEQQHIEDSLIADLDAVSLYPSAMMAMPGFPIGVPKIWTNHLNLDNVDWFIGEVRILTVGKNLHFPLGSFVGEDDSVRHFTNNLEDRIICLDKRALNDLTEFQNVTYKIIRGYYWDEGFNNGIQDIVKNLFNYRLAAKREHNPIQVVYKLLLNALYGKLIERFHYHKHSMMTPKQADVFISRHHNHLNITAHIIEADNFHEYDSVDIEYDDDEDNHFNYPHCGGMVLSYSKHLMNRVMCLAESLNIEIY